MARKIILDCDPGHDDALAILLAHGDPRIDLIAITTVAGNQTLDKTTRNARAVATLAGITDVPIAAGCDRPLVRELHTAPYIHGESGLDGAELPEPEVPLSDAHAVDLIVDLVMDSMGDVTLVPVGPLTNIALALRREPRIARKVQEVVLMGGSFTRGNHTPVAEFNIAVDPEAASAVFDAGWPLTMVGLDLTHQALATPEVLKRFEGLGTPLAGFMAECLRSYGEAYRSFGFAAPPVHDPCAVARVIAPKLVTCVDAEVRVETQGRLTSGATVTAFGSPVRNARVAVELDQEGFWDLMVDAVARIDAPAARDPGVAAHDPGTATA